jgi:glycosyltransferase involved in cell wall biosynthesis
MKIAFLGARGVINKYSGIETYYEELGSRLAERNHEVTIYCRSYFTPNVSVHKGMRIKRYPTPRTKHLETIIHSALCTMDALFRGYDIVQFHALGSAPLAAIPRIVGSKTVVSVRGLDSQREKWNWFAKRYLEACEWASVHGPTATTVVSRPLADYYAQRYGAHTTYIPNGVTLRDRIPPKEICKFGLGRKNYILYVGRLTPEKGCHDLIDAYKRLDCDLKLAFVGGSTYADAYVETLRANESDRILFLGFQTGAALQELFSNAYLYVLPSYIEGLSISLLEGMAYGNCVLTSDIIENVDALCDGHFSFRAGDSAHLYDMMAYLIKNPEQVAVSGEANRVHIEKSYTWDRVTDKTENFFLNLLGTSQQQEFHEP